jgi:hypothetical protein
MKTGTIAFSAALLFVLALRPWRLLNPEIWRHCSTKPIK